jgi:hypothetical protein
LPRTGVILCVNPLITAKPTSAASHRDEAIDDGRCRGKPSVVAQLRYGPVTTDPNLGEASILSHCFLRLKL